MTSTECYDLIRKGVDIEVPGLEVYYDKVVLELRGSCVICVTFYGAEVLRFTVNTDTVLYL